MKRLARATTGYTKQVGMSIAWFAGVVVFASAEEPKIQCQRALKIPGSWYFQHVLVIQLGLDFAIAGGNPMAAARSYRDDL